MSYFYRRSGGGGKAIGAGLLGLAAGAAAAFYLYGTKDGAKKRAKMVKFARMAKDKTLETADEVSEAASEMYENISDTMREKYADLKNIDKKEVSALARRVRGHWDEIKKDIGETLG